MAIIRKYPDASVKSRSEKLFFEQASQLSDDWYVWMNCGLNFESDNILGEFTREIDAILYNPKCGMLIVECKDGKITAERTSADLDILTWKQSGRVLSRSPADQVKTVIHTLHDHFGKMFPKENNGYYRIRVQWAVFFPDMENPGNIIGQIPLSHLFLKGDASSPRTFENKVRRALNTKESSFGGKPYPNESLDGENLQKLLDFFASYGEPSWPELCAMNESMRVQPTELQKMLMRTIERNAQMRIEGVAGSGKSMLVKWEAERLAEKNKRVAVLCYNDLLAEKLETDLNPEKSRNFPIEVHSYFHFAQKYARLSKLPDVPRKEPTDRDAKCEYFANLPDAFDKAINALKKDRSEKTANRFFDAVIIDEGQDFENVWLDTVLKLLKNPKTGVVRFFYDPAQRLYSRDVLGNRTINAMPVMVLPCGFRSTRRILDWVRKETDIRIPCYDNTPLGKNVEVRYYTNPEDQMAMLEREIDKLRAKKIDKKDILVLSMHSRKYSGIKNLANDDFKWSDVNDSLSNQRINVVSVRRYKGLDSRIVILCDMKDLKSNPGFPYHDPHLLLVAATRAREHLIVFKEQRKIGQK